jgi:hypothetical protein
MISRDYTYLHIIFLEFALLQIIFVQQSNMHRPNKYVRKK